MFEEKKNFFLGNDGSTTQNCIARQQMYEYYCYHDHHLQTCLIVTNYLERLWPKLFLYLFFSKIIQKVSLFFISIVIINSSSFIFFSNNFNFHHFIKENNNCNVNKIIRLSFTDNISSLFINIALHIKDWYQCKIILHKKSRFRDRSSKSSN